MYAMSSPPAEFWKSTGAATADSEEVRAAVAAITSPAINKAPIVECRIRSSFELRLAVAHEECGASRIHSKSGASRFKLNPSGASGYSGEPRLTIMRALRPAREANLNGTNAAYGTVRLSLSYDREPLCGGEV
jgi:hypothetical protein